MEAAKRARSEGQAVLHRILQYALTVMVPVLAFLMGDILTDIRSDIKDIKADNKEMHEDISLLQQDMSAIKVSINNQ